jgi:Ca2+-binding EF-hand superfamily protein
MNIPLSDIDKMINEVDADNDGQIDYNEFLEMMKKDLHV